MFRFCEFALFPNSHRRGDADAERLKNLPAMLGRFAGLGAAQQARVAYF